MKLGLAALAAMTMGAPAPAAPGAPPETLRIEPVLAEARVPSVSIARIEGGRIAWVGAWGHQGPGVPATPSTLYNVASLSKPISAETILRAASARGWSMDDTMANFWVDPDLAADPRHRLLTPRISLTHRTGFTNWRYQTEGKLRFDHEPGSRVGYSGEGFEYVARWAERRSGVAFERLAEEMVFRPAGMTETSYTYRPWFEGRLALPYDAEGRLIEPRRTTEYVASDDVHTTAADYARFLISAAERQGLSEAIAADRERVQGSTRETICTGAKATACADETGFGLGWDLAVFGEDRVLWHTGADRGEWTFAYIIPRTGEGAVILTNSQAGYRAVLPIIERSGMHPRFLAHLRAQAAAE